MHHHQHHNGFKITTVFLTMVRVPNCALTPERIQHHHHDPKHASTLTVLKAEGCFSELEPEVSMLARKINCNECIPHHNHNQ